MFAWASGFLGTKVLSVSLRHSFSFESSPSLSSFSKGFSAIRKIGNVNRYVSGSVPAAPALRPSLSFPGPRNTGDWQPGLSHESAWVPPNHSMFPVRPETRTKRQILLFYLKQLAGSLRNHLWKLLIPMVEPFDQVMGGCVIKSQIAVFLSHSSHRSLTQRRNFRWSLLGNSGSSHMGPTEMSADVRSESSRNPVSLLYLGLVKNVQQKMWNKNSRPSHHKYLVVY